MKSDANKNKEVGIELELLDGENENKQDEEVDLGDRNEHSVASKDEIERY